MTGLFLFCCAEFLMLVALLVECHVRRAEVKRLSEADLENVRALQKQHEINLVISELTGPGGREAYLWWLKNRGKDFADWESVATAADAGGEGA